MTYEKEWFSGYGLDDPHQRSYFRRLGLVIALALIVGLVLAPLIGCEKQAELPLCEGYTMEMHRTPLGPMFVLDGENLEKLAAMIQGLNNRTCRLNKPKPDNKKV